jgi:hypothetical protein
VDKPEFGGISGSLGAAYNSIGLSNQSSWTFNGQVRVPFERLWPMVGGR